VAFPVRETVVEALVELAKVAFAEGLADQFENKYPEAGVAVMAVDAPALTVVTVAGVMVPLLSVPGVNVTVSCGIALTWFEADDSPPALTAVTT
jgi:hypothetical protein